MATSGTLKNLRPWQQKKLESNVKKSEETLKTLKRKLEEAKTDETSALKMKHENDEVPELKAKMRYGLVAPPNALYHDEVISSFMFCPICVTVGGGEFTTPQAAKEHCNYDAVHHRILSEGGKKFLDKIKCTRCRVCGMDVFGGDEVLKHLLSDTHRLNMCGLHDANNPVLLNQALDRITEDELQDLLVENLKDVYQDDTNTVYGMDSLGNSLKGNNKFQATNFAGQKKLQHYAGTATGKPYSELKLNNKQKKQGGNAVARLWGSDKIKHWWMQNLGVTFEQINQIRTKFKVPFIYTSLSSGKDCFICHHSFPMTIPLPENEKVAHCVGKQHTEATAAWCGKLDKIFDFKVPLEIRCLLFAFCPDCKSPLTNWNGIIGHLEAKH